MPSRYEDAITLIDETGDYTPSWRAILSTPKNGTDSWVGVGRRPWIAVRRAYKARRDCQKHQCKVHGQELL